MSNKAIVVPADVLGELSRMKEAEADDKEDDIQFQFSSSKAFLYSYYYLEDNSFSMNNKLFVGQAIRYVLRVLLECKNRYFDRKIEWDKGRGLKIEMYSFSDFKIADREVDGSFRSSIDNDAFILDSKDRPNVKLHPSLIKQADKIDKIWGCNNRGLLMANISALYATLCYEYITFHIVAIRDPLAIPIYYYNKKDDVLSTA
jgi:hypothetical protein